LAKKLIADGAIGKPTSLRIRTIVGQTDSAFQAALRPEGYGWRLDKRSPGGHLFDDMVHKYAMALWLLDLDITAVQAVVRRRDMFFEPCACIFEYEDPEVLGMMEVQYAPKLYMRSSYYGADEFFEITGDEGQIWVTRATGEMLDLAPVMLFTGSPTELKTTEFTDLDADWGAGFVRSSQHFVSSLLDGTTPDMPPEMAIKVLQLCFAVYQASEIGTSVDPRTITGSVTPSGWGEWGSFA
jgi:predicted dehydrogenase